MADIQDVGAGNLNSSAGAAPDSQKNSRPLPTKQGAGLHWFAHGPEEILALPQNKQPGSSRWLADEVTSQVFGGSLPLGEGKESAASLLDREERLRLVKEKHNEDRQKKLDELKQQAFAALKFREQKEEERRRRMEELRLRDTDRRHQVEERKRQIWEAERDRREAILRKNQEREARIETKRRNERSSIVFAFGSSTPRMLEPADTGGSYWATRRATSTSNVMTLSMSAAPGPLTRRSSERELDGSKKRATSAGGINRAKQPGDEVEGEESVSVTTVPAAGASSARAARRKTDLMPTQPSPRDLTPRPMRSPGLRSGEVTPSRPQSSLSQHSVSSAATMSSSVHAAFKPRPAPRRPRPFSIAVTGVSDTSPRLSLSAEHRNAKSPSTAQDREKPPLPKSHMTKKPATPKPEAPRKPTDKIKSTKSSASSTPKATPLQSPGVEAGSKPLVEAGSKPLVEATTITTSVTSVFTVSSDSVATTETVDVTVVESKSAESTPTPVLVSQEVPVTRVKEGAHVIEPEPTTDSALQEPASDLAECDMTASMLAKTRISTEEEAKAALAERRRLAREQAEREAELERQRIEAERLAEEKRIKEEEEEQKRMEEEQLRLLEEARQAEQERLRQAIEEAQKREEEERLQREEEAKQKIEKEEAEKKAREEAEKLRQEMEIRLKKEEEDRLVRRKRVEAIMSRTRGKGSTPANTPTKDDGDESPSEEGRSEPHIVSEHEQFLHSERSHSADNNSTLQQNGHQNGVDNVVEQNNVTNNLLDLSIDGMNPLAQPITEQILAHTTTNTSSNGKLVNEDSVNFNNPPSSHPFIAFQDNKKQDTVNDLLS